MSAVHAGAWGTAVMLILGVLEASEQEAASPGLRLYRKNEGQRVTIVMGSNFPASLRWEQDTS